MFSGLTNNTETGLGLGIRASHKGIDGGHCGVSCNSNLPLLKTSSSFDGHFTQTVLPRGEILNIKPKSQQHRLAASLCTLSKLFLLRWINMDLCPLQKNQSTDKTGRWRNPWGCWPYLPVSDHNRWPLQGADLSEKRWFGFTYSVYSPCQRLWHRNVWGIFVKQVVFLTVNHRGALPLRELHSTDEAIVWRDPGGSLVFSRPVSDYERIHPFRGCRWHRHTCMWRLCEAGRFSYGESPRTPPLEGTSLHRRHNSVERPWGILSLFKTCFWLRVNSPFQRL